MVRQWQQDALPLKNTGRRQICLAPGRGLSSSPGRRRAAILCWPLLLSHTHCGRLPKQHAQLHGTHEVQQAAGFGVAGSGSRSWHLLPVHELLQLPCKLAKNPWSSINSQQFPVHSLQRGRPTACLLHYAVLAAGCCLCPLIDCFVHAAKLIRWVLHRSLRPGLLPSGAKLWIHSDILCICRAAQHWWVVLGMVNI